MHPVVFDIDHPDANGIRGHRTSALGRHDGMGNVLLPLRREGSVGASEDDFGVLNFEFYEKTYVNYITLLNVDNFAKIFVTQADGSISVLATEAAGPGGVQAVKIGRENVLRLSVTFKTFAAVVDMDLCLNRIHK